MQKSPASPVPTSPSLARTVWRRKPSNGSADARYVGVHQTKLNLKFTIQTWIWSAHTSSVCLPSGSLRLRPSSPAGHADPNRIFSHENQSQNVSERHNRPPQVT